MTFDEKHVKELVCEWLDAVTVQPAAPPAYTERKVTRPIRPVAVALVGATVVLLATMVIVRAPVNDTPPAASPRSSAAAETSPTGGGLMLNGADTSTSSAVVQSSAPAEPHATSTPAAVVTSGPSAATTENTDGVLDPCQREEIAPPSLIGGSPSGEVTERIELNVDNRLGTAVAWGAGPARVTQLLGSSPVVDPNEYAPGSVGRVDASDGSTYGVVVPIGDPPVSEIVLLLPHNGCFVQYAVGPGVELQAAYALLAAWLA